MVPALTLNQQCGDALSRKHQQTCMCVDDRSVLLEPSLAQQTRNFARHHTHSNLNWLSTHHTRHIHDTKAVVFRPIATIKDHCRRSSYQVTSSASLLVFIRRSSSVCAPTTQRPHPVSMMAFPGACSNKHVCVSSDSSSSSGF